MQQVETITLPHDFGEFSEIIDVRSPSEFAEDHLPGAINLPVLSDEQRIEIGTLHNTNPFAARRQGAQLIAINIAQHIAGHLADKEKTYAPLVYCWRGGMRSNSLSYILRSIGWRARLLDGGYKAFRKFSSEDLDRILSCKQLKLTVLAGPTGVAKTRLLHSLKELGAQVLDLEGLARHRGSILGLAPDSQQPGQKYFESQLWQTLCQFDPAQPVFTEAESNRIGKLHCPPPLWKKLGQSQMVSVELPIDQRAAFLLDDYPHFTDNPEHLKNLLQQLIKLRGHAQVEQWVEQIDQQQWLEFVASILKNHYDIVYRRAGDPQSNYPAATRTLTLKDFSNDSLTAACKELLSND